MSKLCDTLLNATNVFSSFQSVLSSIFTKGIKSHLLHRRVQRECLSRAQTLNGRGINARPVMGSRLGGSQPGGFSNLKLCSKRAKTRKTSIRAKDSPKQPRRPAENGRNWSGFGGRNSPSSLRNLVGLNSFGSSQISGSWWRDHKLANTVVFFGI